jgi:hypothetical protein
MGTPCFTSRQFVTVQLAVLFAAFVAWSQPIITQQPTNQVVLNGGTAVFSVSVFGSGSFTYQWQMNGTNLPTSIIWQHAHP